MSSNPLSRRQFLRTSLAAPLAAATGLSLLSGCASQRPQPLAIEPQTQLQYLNDDQAAIWWAIMPVVIQSSRSVAADTDNEETQRKRAAVIQRIDAAIVQLTAANQEELEQLIDILDLTPTRGLMTGIWGSWQNADYDEIDDFLSSWRDSGLGLLNKSYNAVVQISAVTSYGHPDYWEASQFPGPPDYAMSALPQFKTSEKS